MRTSPLIAIAMLIASTAALQAAEIKPGDVIGKDEAAKVSALLSPGNLVLVKQGMQMKIVPTERLEWSPPYKTATEKYSPQVGLTSDGEFKNYVAGLPFPLIDPNDPQAATKVMWNFSYRPVWTDDLDLRDVEVATYEPGKSDPAAHFTFGHFMLYNNVGRTEVAPIPTDPEATGAGIRYRFAAAPFLEPQELLGRGFVRYRHLDPNEEDNVWISYRRGNSRRVEAGLLSDIFGMLGGGREALTYMNNLDPDSYFGFMAKIEDFTYRLLGQKPMLACVHAENSPAKPCALDGNRTVCPENWEIRQLYEIEATVKPLTWHQRIGTDPSTIPRRIFYIDSEGWIITASDQYDRSGQLWKTLATFYAYRDRPVPDAKVAIWPFKRIFQTALVDEDVTNGVSSVVYTPAPDTPDRECWYINTSTITNATIEPHMVAKMGLHE